jgi:hypothetical protein
MPSHWNQLTGRSQFAAPRSRRWRRPAPRDFPHDAAAAGLVLQPHVIGARRDAGDPQALVVLDRSVAIVPALVGTPAVLARRRHPKVRDRMQCEIPEPDALAPLRHRTAAVSEGNRDKQQAEDFCCVTVQRRHSEGHAETHRRIAIRSLEQHSCQSNGSNPLVKTFG